MESDSSAARRDSLNKRRRAVYATRKDELNKKRRERHAEKNIRNADGSNARVDKRCLISFTEGTSDGGHLKEPMFPEIGMPSSSLGFLMNPKPIDIEKEAANKRRREVYATRKDHENKQRRKLYAEKNTSKQTNSKLSSYRKTHISTIIEGPSCSYTVNQPSCNDNPLAPEVSDDPSNFFHTHTSEESNLLHHPLTRSTNKSRTRSNFTNGILLLQVTNSGSWLDFFRRNQRQIRAELYQGVVDSVDGGETSARNIVDAFARTLLYKDFPIFYVWDAQGRFWKRRKRQFVIGRIISASPNQACSNRLLPMFRILSIWMMNDSFQ